MPEDIKFSGAINVFENLWRRLQNFLAAIKFSTTANVSSAYIIRIFKHDNGSLMLLDSL